MTNDHINQIGAVIEAARRTHGPDADAVWDAVRPQLHTDERSQQMVRYVIDVVCEPAGNVQKTPQ